MERLTRAGIDAGDAALLLEEEGIAKFNAPFEKLLKAIDDQKLKA
jgi:transaldolase